MSPAICYSMQTSVGAVRPPQPLRHIKHSSRPFTSRLLSFLLPSAVLTKAAFLCSHTDKLAACPFQWHMRNSEYSSPTVITTRPLCRAVLWLPLARACHDPHDCIWHQKTQPRTSTSRKGVLGAMEAGAKIVCTAWRYDHFSAIRGVPESTSLI
nr:hypothetical protein CFP56_54416 [Quercus suber]